MCLVDNDGVSVWNIETRLYYIGRNQDIKLSTREIEVLEQLSKGLSYNIIADNLILSPSTVRKHIENIYTKLQVHNKLEAIQKAKNNNLI